MALAKLKKIQLIASTPNKEKILEILQNQGVLDITEIKEESGIKPDTYREINKLQKTELNHANVGFAINLLSKYSKKKGLFAQPITLTIKEVEEKTKEFDYSKIVDECLELEEELTKAQNNLSTLKNEKTLYSPWKNLSIKLEELGRTKTTNTVVGTLKTNAFGPAIEKIHKTSSLISSDIINSDEVNTYIVFTFSKELENEIRQILSEYKFQEADLPKTKGLIKDYLKKIDEKIAENKEKNKKTESELKKLTKHLDNLKIVYDGLGWRKEKLETGKKFGNTNYNFVINGWISHENIEPLKEELEKETKEFEITELTPEEDEKPPVVIKNNKFLAPFEAVSKIYGLPKHDELDPTPFLASFFIVFFALCLTDAGYGIIMFVLMALILKYFKLAESVKKLVKLLMYGGIVTFVIGALFGGWFGLTPDQVPEFLTYTAENGEKMFIFQKINAISNPITVLILALTLGYIQVLLGVVMKFVHEFKTKDRLNAVLDTGTWVFMISGIGFYILTATGILPESLGAVGKWWMILAAAALVITQGRGKKNIIVKIFLGIISLYGLVGYMSDVLSYSRLLALGLATTIIGLAVNIVTDLVGGLPYIGWLLMALVFIGGHIFNLAINALGSFIHSGRLQFVEFFTKFMEGGGAEFRPLSKKSKYIYIKQ
ncbi:hypothetical protein GF366_04920 [Candidatus Peregrinibacteria bacterium]|nr:hypothetical protein [Candidatus Peregrinibacteria bacterium]